MKNIRYSLIIPHYNIPHLLKRLLDTIPNRNDLEIIVVDDCSSVGNEDLNKIRIAYKNVDFYSTGSNGGGGKARNIGLSHAHGDYVFFADADDYFTPGLNSILDIYSTAGDEYDMIFFDAQSVDSDTYRPSKRANHLNNYINIIESNREKAIISLKYLFGEPWCKLIKKNLIENNRIRFEERPVHNDTYFSYMCGFHSSNVDVLPIVAYCLTERSMSVSKYQFNNKWVVRTEVFSMKNRFLEANNIPIFDELLLTPFKIAYKYDRNKLKELYKIAHKYGYSKNFIIKKICRQYIKRITNKFLNR